MFEPPLFLFLACFWAAQAILVFKDWLADIFAPRREELTEPLHDLEPLLDAKEVESWQFEPECPGVGLRDLFRFPICILYWALLFLFWPALITGMFLSAWESCADRRN
ncbi:hypothetical protein Pan44_45110 [Caulifigura coniformis]|uniref:Uncharacterized protein n=1 Tax=Caulifigura coniformis TaxID=2527983 RepID=A0A517SK08_9PLAN|nr:hypothetical protein [Caulifigura coniformis]QDT56457.1 hypothetical protein Pan44_45110 [Caulifigura coniformis]